MTPGGSKIKGSSFERLTAAALSRWISHGMRDDLLCRSVLSGGRFTLAEKKDKVLGLPGDLMAADPLSFEFLSLFSCECKHRANLGIDSYLLGMESKSWLAGVVKLTSRQAKRQGLNWLVIAKQNHRSTIVLMEEAVGRLTLQAAQEKKPRYHILHNGTVWVTFLEDFVLISPDEFIKLVKMRNAERSDLSS